MRHVPGEANFEAEAPDKSRYGAGTGRRWTRSFGSGKRIRIRPADCRRSAITEHHPQSTLRSRRRGNGGRESRDIPPLRQGKRDRRLHADSARLRLRWVPRLWRWRWMSWLWRWWRWWRMSWLCRWRWMSWLRPWLWLQRLRLRRLWWLRRLWLGRSLGRLWFRRLLLIVGRLPFLLIRNAPCRHRQVKIFGRARQRPGNSCAPMSRRRLFRVSRGDRLSTSHNGFPTGLIRRIIGYSPSPAAAMRTPARKLG